MSQITSSILLAGIGTLGTVTTLEATTQTPLTNKEQITALVGSVLFQAVLLGFKELKKWLEKRKRAKQVNTQIQPKQE